MARALRGQPMVFRHRLGWLTVALIPLLLAGLGAIYAGIHLQFEAVPRPKAGAGWAVMALGAFTTLATLGGIFMVWDVTIDLTNGRVIRRRGALGLVKRKIYRLELFNKVVVSAITNPGSRRYTIHLAGPNANVYLTEYPRIERALTKAGEVAGYLGVPVEERTR